MLLPEIIARGYEYCKPTKEKVDLFPNYNMLHFVICGKGYFNGRILEAGQGFLCRQEDRVSYYPDEKDPWVYCWINFCDAGVLSEIISVISFDEDFTFSFDTSKPYFDIVSNSYIPKGSPDEPCCEDSNNPDLNRGVYFALLSFLKADSHRKNVDGADSVRKRHVEQAMRYIDYNCHRAKFNISSLSEEMHLSRAYLRNLFSLYMDTSPKKYLLQTRMERASKLLLSVDAPISIVASSVGYTDAFQFSKIFKKYYGLSPENYRKSARKT